MEIVFRHLHLARSKESEERGGNVRIALKLQPQRLGHGLACEVVFGRAESSHKDNDVCAGERDSGGAYQIRTAVAHYSLESDINPQFVEPGGEMKRIRVLPERGQQLRADGNDLCIHSKEFK